MSRSNDSGGSPRLLVVEDDAAIRELLGCYLSPSYDVLMATCRDEATEHLKAGTGFDLVLLDLRLPLRRQDMVARGNSAGLEILDLIRRRKMLKRGGLLPLPVVVMTAHGDGTDIPATVFVKHGASDYVDKPFPSRECLLDKIEQALRGEGALVPAGSHRAYEIRIAFDLDARAVQIETLPRLKGSVFDLLDALRGPFEADLDGRKAPENFQRVSAGVLARDLGIKEQSLRQRIRRFRQEIGKGFEERCGRALGKNEIIENHRDWRGYRLNPDTVRLLHPGEMPPAQEPPPD